MREQYLQYLSTLDENALAWMMDMLARPGSPILNPQGYTNYGSQLGVGQGQVAQAPAQGQLPDQYAGLSEEMVTSPGQVIYNGPQELPTRSVPRRRGSPNMNADEENFAAAGYTG